MKHFNWEEIKKLAERKATLLTKTRIPFQIIDASEGIVTVRVSSGEEHAISRANLEKAVQKIQAGVVFNGPKDYREQVADDRLAYAWVILRVLGYLIR